MDKKIVEAINEQIKNEFYSANLYLAMAAYCESINLPGFSHWLKLQAKEENSHGMKFFEYMADRGARINIGAIAQPPVQFLAPVNVFEKTLEHEMKVTSLIYAIHDLALAAKDKATEVALEWFITEQVEEEKNASNILEKLKMAGESKGALLYIDKELGKRA